MVGTQIDRNQGRELASNPGFVLEKSAALAWDRSCAAFGKRVLISGAWRSYQTQVELFDSEKHPATGRYVRGSRAGQKGLTTDVRGRTADGGLYRGSWWTRKAGTAAAAVPGTSNHGSGRAVDVKTRREGGDPGWEIAVVWSSWTDADRKRFLRVAAEHGWADDEGRQVDEVWHLTYYPERDQHRGEKTTTQTQEVPDMDATQAKQLSDIHAALPKLNDLFTGVAPKIDTVPDGSSKVTMRTAVKMLLASRTNAAAISKAVSAAVVKKLPDVDQSAITETVTAAVDKALADIEITLTKEN